MTSDEQRAEEKLRQAERLVAEAAAKAATGLTRFVARTREEIEDVWAEAQSIGQSR